MLERKIMPQSELMNLIQHIRQRYRQIVLFCGFSRLITILLVLIMTYGVVDWYLRIDNQWFRLFLLATMVSVLSYYFISRTIIPFFKGLAEGDAARRLEIQLPDIKDQVQSAVCFLENQSLSKSHSFSLQNQLINRVDNNLKDVTWNNIFNIKYIYFHASLLGLVLFISMIMVVGYQAEASVAVKRLFSPFSTARWPNRDQLQIIDAEFNPVEKEIISFLQGEKNILYVRNQIGTLPPEVVLHYSEEGENIQTELLQKLKIQTGEEETEELAIISIPYIGKNSRIRITGGDDLNEKWFRLLKVTPPKLHQIKMTITSPEYTGKTSESYSALSGRYDVLLNSRIQIDGVLSRHVEKGVISNGENEYPVKWNTALREKFQANFRITGLSINKLYLKLVDQKMVELKIPLYEINGIADKPPQVKVLEPNSNLNVTASAVVPIRIHATDDYGLSSLNLKYESGRQLKGEIHLVDFQEKSKNKYNAVYEWDLEYLSLLPGMKISYSISGSDFYTHNSQAHQGKSLINQLVVVTHDQKLQEIKGSLSKFSRDVYDLIQLERIASGELKELITQLKNAGFLKKDDYRLFKNAILHQDQFSGRLISPQGPLIKSHRILEEFQNNRLEEKEIQQQLLESTTVLQGIKDNEIEEINQKLKEIKRYEKDLFKSLKESRGFNKLILEKMVTVSRLQNHVVASLEQIHNRLKYLKNTQEIFEEIRQLLVNQKKIHEKTINLSSVTLTRSEISLSSQEKTDLSRLALKQSQLADQYQKTVIIESVGNDHRDNTSPYSKSLSYLKQSNLLNLFNEASQSIRENRVGQAVDKQKIIIDKLASVLEMSKKNESLKGNQLTRSALKSAEENISAIYDKQKKLNQSLQKIIRNDSASSQLKPGKGFVDRQDMVREELINEYKKIQSQKINISLSLLENVSRLMESASIALEQGEVKDADEHQKESLKLLKEFQKEIQGKTESLENTVKGNSYQKAFEELGDIYLSQKKIYTNSLKIHNEFLKSNRFNRVMIKEIVQLAVFQESLLKQTEKIASVINEDPEIGYMLLSIVDAMSSSLQDYRRKRISYSTIYQQETLLELLKFFAELSGDSDDSSNKSKNKKNQKSKSDKNKKPGEPDHSLSGNFKIRMLHQLHAMILFRMEKLLLMKDSPGEDKQSQFINQLSIKHGHLSRMTKELLGKMLSAFKEKEEKERELADKQDVTTKKKQNVLTLKTLNLHVGLINENMETVNRILKKKMITSEGIDKQEIVVKNLDDLLVLLRSKQSDEQSEGNMSGAEAKDKENRNQKKDEKKKTSDSESSGDSTGSGDGKGANVTSIQNLKKIEESAESRNQQLKIEKFLKNRNHQQIWGHLPTRLKRKMNNVKVDRYLPQYEGMIRRYYDSLAKPQPEGP
jgi:hypothetical protein